MDLLLSKLKYLPEYIIFFLRFPFTPNRGMREYSNLEKPNERLLAFFIAGVVISLGIAGIAEKLGTVDDPSVILSFLSSLTIFQLTVATLLFVIGMAAVTHVGAKIAMSFESKHSTYSYYLGGTLVDTINAALGFGSFFIPFVTLCISGLLILGKYRDVRVIIPMISILIICFTVFYWSSVLAATHSNTTRLQAFLASCAALTMCGVVVGLLSSLI